MSDESGIKYSVLMSVYYKEKANNLEEAMNSIWNQSVATDDFVLVCDGPLTDSLDKVIIRMRQNHPELHVVRLKKNNGLGYALNVGIKKCKNELIARMDSDDISRGDRCEKQLSVFQSNLDLSIVSGTVQEFSKSIDEIGASRVLPEHHEEIVSFAKTRNPFNHPCVMYKKSAVESSGGYRDFYLLEDYYLWIRMIKKGFLGYNIQSPLLWMRAGSDMYKRRSGLKYAKSQIALCKYMKRSDFITTGEFLKSSVSRTIVALLPNGIRTFLYRKMLRKC